MDSAIPSKVQFAKNSNQSEEKSASELKHTASIFTLYLARLTLYQFELLLSHYLRIISFLIVSPFDFCIIFM